MREEAEEHCAASHGQKHARARRPTYLVRKDETKRLKKQLEEAQRELARLRRGETQEVTTIEKEIAQANALAVSLSSAIREQQTGLIKLSSLLSDYFRKLQRHPMHVPIHLPRNETERQEILLSLHDRKVFEARRFVTERSCLLDLSKPYQWIENYETADSLFSTAILDVNHFGGGATVRSVSDAVSSFATNIELHVSDNLEDITIREDDEETFRGGVTQRHILTETKHGVVLDSNLAVFRQYFAQGEAAAVGFPNEHAVYTVQSVESDELHPYKPLEQLRRDAVIALVILALPPQSDTDSRSRVVVVRCGRVQLRPCDMNISHQVLRSVQLDSKRWADMMLQSVRDHHETNRLQR